MKSFVQKSIQDKRVFSSYLFTWRCYSVSDLGIFVETKQRTPSALTLFPSFPLMIKKVTDYEKLWPICWYGDWSEGICSSVNDTECSEKKNCECSQCEPNLRPSSQWSSALPQRAIGELWRAKPFNEVHDLKLPAYFKDGNIDTWCSRTTMMLMKMINFKPGIFGVNEDVI